MVLEMTLPQFEKTIKPTHDIKLFTGRANVENVFTRKGYKFEYEGDVVKNALTGIGV